MILRQLMMTVLLLQLSGFASATTSPSRVFDEGLVEQLLKANTLVLQRPLWKSIQDSLGDHLLPVEQIRALAASVAAGTHQTQPGKPNHLASAPLSLLYRQHSLRLFDARTTTLLTECLANPLTYAHGDAELISRLIGKQFEAQIIPSEAMTTLRGALEHLFPQNRHAAIRAMAYTPNTSSYWLPATEDLANVLAQSDEFYTKLLAVRGLGQLGRDRLLGAVATKRLKTQAVVDGAMPIRLAALTVILNSTLNPLQSDREIEALIAELERPTPGLWTAKIGGQEYQNLKERALQMLGRWYEPNYPERVVDLFVKGAKAHSPEESLRVLRQLRQRDALSDKQRFALRQVAAEHRNQSYRAKIYQLGLPNLTTGSLLNAQQTLVSSGKPDARLAAAHQLLRRYQEQPTPKAIADLAAAKLLDTQDSRLTVVLGQLVASSMSSLSERSRQLLDALRQHPKDRNLPDILLGLYTGDDLDQFATQWVADTTLPMHFRVALIQRLAKDSDQPMSAGLRSAVLDAGVNSWTDYQLASASIRAFQARADTVPVALKVRSKGFQSGGIMGAWLFCLVTGFILCLATIVGIFKLPLQANSRQGIRFAKRSGLLLIWAAVSLVLLAFFAYAFLGFIGHNSAPSPNASLKYNWPLYPAYLIYGALGLAILRSAKNAKHSGLSMETV